MTAAPTLDAHAQALADGAGGPASALAMRVVLAMARAVGATRLRPIESAHVDGCLYHGRAGLDFARRLVDLGGRVTVRTTLNVGSLDLRHPDTVRADPDLREAGRALMEAYLALGCEQTWTCAPYQISHRPAPGTHVAWAESNAIAFVNSVLGARTDRYGDFIDIAAAITGLVPDGGLHADGPRAATLVLDCTAIPARAWQDEAAWAALGVLLGDIAGTRVAALTGLTGDLADGGTTEDRLKALAATAASAGGVALFHVVGVTPEAPDLATALGLRDGTAAPGAREPAGVPPGPVRTPARPASGEVPVVPVTPEALRAARDRLSTATGSELDAVSLGTPHFSVTEFAALAAELADGAPFHPAVDVYVSTSRAVLAEADRHGYVQPLRAAGGRIVTDTCTYVTPILDPSVRVVMTNSGKWAWYAPGNLGIDVVLGSLADCVASARAGRVVRDEGSWASTDGPEHDAQSIPVGAQAGPTPDRAIRHADRPGAGAAAPPGSAATAVRGTVLHPGAAEGRLLVLDDPVSFWGGVSAAGIIIDAHHPQRGVSVTGRVVVMPAGRGSSSSSSVLAEQIRVGAAPAAIVLSEPDAILVLGAAVAAELYGSRVPVLVLDRATLATLPDGRRARIDADSDGAAGLLEVSAP